MDKSVVGKGDKYTRTKMDRGMEYQLIEKCKSKRSKAINKREVGENGVHGILLGMGKKTNLRLRERKGMPSPPQEAGREGADWVHQEGHRARSRKGSSFSTWGRRLIGPLVGYGHVE